MPYRKKHAIHSYEVDETDIDASIRKIDKRRANYYNYYTDRTWGNADNYDIVLNAGKFGIEGCVKLLKELVEAQG